MPAEPVTVTERSLIPREILTTLAALCFACSVAGVVIAAIGWERGTVKNQLFARYPRYTQDYSRFIFSVGPFIPFIMIIAGAWNALRIAVFALGLFVFWAGLGIDLVRTTDVNRTEGFFTGSGTNSGAKMLEAGMIVLLVFSLFSLLSISPRDTTRWWRRSSRLHHPTTHAVTAPGMNTVPVAHHRSHGPLFIVHYILATIGFLITLAGCAVLLENIRRNFLDIPLGFEASIVLQYMYFTMIVAAFFAAVTGFLCDSDLYAGFSLALNTFTIIFALRFAIDIDNIGYGGKQRKLIISGLSLLFAGAVISSAGILSRRSNVHVNRDATTVPNPALP